MLLAIGCRLRILTKSLEVFDFKRIFADRRLCVRNILITDSSDFTEAAPLRKKKSELSDKSVIKRKKFNSCRGVSTIFVHYAPLSIPRTPSPKTFLWRDMSC